MFDGLLQPMHLLLIFVIALVGFGPKKLPELGKGLGETNPADSKRHSIKSRQIQSSWQQIRKKKMTKTSAGKRPNEINRKEHASAGRDGS